MGIVSYSSVYLLCLASGYVPQKPGDVGLEKRSRLEIMTGKCKTEQGHKTREYYEKDRQVDQHLQMSIKKTEKMHRNGALVKQQKDNSKPILQGY